MSAGLCLCLIIREVELFLIRRIGWGIYQFQMGHLHEAGTAFGVALHPSAHLDPLVEPSGGEKASLKAQWFLFARLPLLA